MNNTNKKSPMFEILRNKKKIQNNKNNKNNKNKKIMKTGTENITNTIYTRYHNQKHSKIFLGVDLVTILKLIPINNKFIIMLALTF